MCTQRRFARGPHAALLAVSIAGLLLLTLAGCQRGESPSPAGASAAGQKYNLILVSLDTTRADHIGCYGFDQVKTPNIDRLAAEGTRFAECVSPVPITLPSHSSILTGSDPYVHGIRDNGAFSLAEQNVTLAETLSDAGYATHAILGAIVLNASHGLDQGFDTYDDLDTKPRPAVDLGAAGDEAGDPMQQWADFRSDLQRPADQITDLALARLQDLTQQEQPFFLFLHYYDPHQPYLPPEPFRQEYVTDLYTGEIAFFDTQFGRLMDAIRNMGLAENTMIVFLSDHGEGRGQHGESTHSFFVYDATQLVPLILWCPGQVAAGKVVSSQVRLIDVMPTVLDFLGQQPAAQCQGQSLLPLIAQADPPADLPAYGETIATKYAFHFSPLRFLRDDGWKYIHAPVPELYNLTEDPGEVFNLAVQQPERVESMRNRLRQIIADAPPAPGGRSARADIDPEELARLQALGYVGAGAPGGDDDSESENELDDFDPVGPNPRDEIGSIQLYADAVGAFESGQLEQAEQMYRELLKRSPDNPAFVKALADMLVVAERPEEALEQYRRVVELVPEDVIARRDLARFCALSDNLEEAAATYREMIKLDPTDASTYLELANVLAEQQLYEAALHEFEIAAELRSEWAELQMNWGMALLAAGDAQKAEQPLRKAIRLEPHADQARVGLAKALHAQNRTADAIKELLTLAERYPNDANLMRRLGEWYSQVGDSENSVKYLEHAAQIDSEVPQAQFNLGLGLAAAGRHADAIPRFREAVRLDPQYVRAWAALADSLAATQQQDEAEQVWRRCVELAPDQPDSYRRCAMLLLSQGREADAIAQLRLGFEKAQPDPALSNDLAWCLATSANEELRDGQLAVRAAERANELTGNNIPALLDTLAAAYARAARYEDARRTAAQAIDLANQQGAKDLAERIRTRATLYEKNEPFTQ